MLSFPPLPPNALIFSVDNEYYTLSSPMSPSSAALSDEEDLGNQSDPGYAMRALPARLERKPTRRLQSVAKDNRTIESESLDDILE